MERLNDHARTTPAPDLTMSAPEVISGPDTDALFVAPEKAVRTAHNFIATLISMPKINAEELVVDQPLLPLSPRPFVISLAAIKLDAHPPLSLDPHPSHVRI
jgi:hypothetical protein